MEKRYQVFVSSTYADLKEERRSVMQTLIELDCIPAGMELFPATDQEQFEFIKRVIDDCDYYLLIIGGRYGCTTSDGVSYTEQEYDYAVSRGLRVIALVHENPDQIPFGKSEKDPAFQAKLQAFRNKVATNRLVRFWKSAEELPGLVSLSLSKTIKTFPAVGWVRADRTASEDVLLEINDLRKRNEQLQAKLSAALEDSRPQLEGLAGLDDKIPVKGSFYHEYYRSCRTWTASPTWRQVFGIISPYLLRHPTDQSVKEILQEGVFKLAGENGSSPTIDDQDFQTISVQLRALGLVNVKYTSTTTGGMAVFWSWTKAGERLMLELRTIRSSSSAAQ
jgi:hypothetical protein